MNGSTEISDNEKEEMRRDARDGKRARTFRAAYWLSQQGSIDDYIDFLSENMPLADIVPSKHVTDNYKL